MASNYPTEVVSQSGDELVIRVFIRPVATVSPHRTRIDPAVSTEGVHPFGQGDVSVSVQDVRVRLARGETLTPSRQVHGRRGRGPRCDVVGNSVGTKSTPTENVLALGTLAKQIAERGGKSLVDELASDKHACWTWGEIKFTGAHGLNRSDSSPKHICHFCVPRQYNGDATYLQIMTLFERALNITHDLSRSSIAFPLVGAGINGYPVMEVIKAMVDACSLFRQKDSRLKKVVIVVWERDQKNQQIIESQCASILRAYKPRGNGYREIIPRVSDYSDPKQAFIKSMGKDRMTKIVHVEVLPIEKGARLEKYKAEVRRVQALRPDMNKVESYGWHGTRGDTANLIKKNGFDFSQIKRHVYGKGAYFGGSADIAHGYAIYQPGAHEPEGTRANPTRDPQGVFTILLCKLVTGKRQLGVSHQDGPIGDYDSARNRDGSYYVIFKDDAILPIAIIEYTICRNE